MFGSLQSLPSWSRYWIAFPSVQFGWWQCCFLFCAQWGYLKKLPLIFNVLKSFNLLFGWCVASFRTEMYRRRRLNHLGDVTKWIRLRISHIVNRSIVNSFLIFPMRCIDVGDWTMQAMYRSGFAYEYRYIVTSLRPSLICSMRWADAGG